MVVVDDVGRHHQVELQTLDVLPAAPPQRAGGGAAPAGGDGGGVGVGVEAEVGDDVGEVGEGDVGAEGGGGGEAGEAGAGAELEEPEGAAAGEEGEEGAAGGVEAVGVEEGGEGGRCRPELEGEALGRLVADHQLTVDGSELEALLLVLRWSFAGANDGDGGSAGSFVAFIGIGVGEEN